MRRLVVVLLVLSSHTALAQAPGEVPAREDTHPPRDEKSILGAYLVTLAATAGPTGVGSLIAMQDEDGPSAAVGGMIATGALVLGPSAGHWYVGEGVTTGLVLRVGGAAAIGMLALWDPYLERPELTIPGLIGSLAVIETGLVWDLVTLPRAVRRYNREHSIAPLVTHNGVALAGTF